MISLIERIGINNYTKNRILIVEILVKFAMQGNEKNDNKSSKLILIWIVR